MVLPHAMTKRAKVILPAFPPLVQCPPKHSLWSPNRHQSVKSPSHAVEASVLRSGKRDHTVMLSAAKHLDAQRDRPFAAAQGDTRGKQQARPRCHAEPQQSISTPLETDPSLTYSK